ncbi:kinetochore protein SPC25 homolog [Typha angustifolia]|uniref:kinetochore protein SPC25 homolog n=1 Tax=Typha angustifolia TaxID=59011 RepID=UPI003C2AEAF7
MQAVVEEGMIRRRMSEIRLACEREIRNRREKDTLALASFRRSLHSIRSLAQETLANREKLGRLKDQLKELESELGETLAVKTCKVSKYTAISEYLSNIIARGEQLKKIVADQRRKRDEYASVISKQIGAVEALEEKSNQDAMGREDIEEAIMWYYKVLGFRAVGGEGVKFIFNKIDSKDAEKEYSFTIRLDDDKYNLLHCDPYIEDINELIKDLNKTNDLFKFVRIMREKFQAATLNGLLMPSSVCPDSSSVTISSPPPTSVDSRSEKSIDQSRPYIQAKDQHDHPKKALPARMALSPHSVRRSPRLMVKRFL